ncbi:MAG TPA: DUF4352 domain-containing protein [Bacillales bacterium]|nr:DUF4352 domain-containing protein [Bacillales bacterium]
MKKAIFLFGVLLFSLSFLWGCNGGGKESQKTTANISDDSMEQNSDEIGNQVGLEVGEVGTIQDTLGTYEVKLKSADIKKEVKGLESKADIFILVKLSIKNVGDHPIKAGEVIESVKLLDDHKGGGEDKADHTKGLNTFKGKGEIQPGTSKNGVLLFDMPESEYYQMVWNFGFTGTLSNKVTWEFDASEAK